MMCQGCGAEATLCRIRKGRADYYCAGCLDDQMDNHAQPGDTWLASQRA